MKKAAFSNLINIMYYLDRCEEVIALCQKHKDSKLLDKTAKKMLDKSSRQAALMAFHKVDSCHFEEMIEIEESDFEVEEEVAEDEGN